MCRTSCRTRVSSDQADAKNICSESDHLAKGVIGVPGPGSKVAPWACV